MKNLITPSRLALALISLSGIAAYVLSPVIAFHVQWPLFEALRTTAAIIFAVIGSWIAIVFPDRLKLMRSGGFATGNTAGSTRFLDLFQPVVHSTVILCIILVLGVAAPIVQGIATDPDTIDQLRRISFGVLVTMTLWQVWTVVLTLVPASNLKSAMDRDVSLGKAADAFRGLGTEEDPPPTT